MELKFSIEMPPRTKKNSQQIWVNRKTGRPLITQSDAYKAYRKGALMMIPARARKHIDYPINLQAIYYMETRRKVDLINLLEATCDILVEAGVIEDDNSQIVAAHDGSRVLYDKARPRTEVTIKRLED